MHDLVEALATLDADFMPGLATIHHPPTGPTEPVNADGSGDDSGAGTDTIGVACRFSDVLTSMSEALRGMRLTEVADAVMWVPLGTTVTFTDQVLYNGAKYEVAGTNSGQSWATSLAIALKLVK